MSAPPPWVDDDWPTRDGKPLECPCCGSHDLDTAEVGHPQALPAVVTCAACDSSCSHDCEVLALTEAGWVSWPAAEQIIPARQARRQLRLR